MTRTVYDVTTHISHGTPEGKPRDFYEGDRVTWRSFYADEQEGRRTIASLIASGAVRERDLDEEELMAVGMKGRWKPLEKLGSGGQGSVFRALDTQLVDLAAAADQIGRGVFAATRKGASEASGDPVELLATGFRAFAAAQDPSNQGALKVLHPADDPSEHDKALSRMRNEIRAYESVRHTNLLRVLDHDLDEGWLVTQYQYNGTLEDRIVKFRGDVLGTLKAIAPLVEAVAELHKGGTVHRDIKPGNVFVGPDGALVLGDAGLAFFQEDDGITRLSETLEKVGTRDWMPLYAQGQRLENVTPSFDVFSLCKLMWAMVAGRSKIPDQVYGLTKGPMLEELFPKSGPARELGALLKKVLVAEDSGAGIRDASALFGEVRDLEILMRAKLCRACQEGCYGDGVRDQSPFGPVEKRVCKLCGHLQVFQR